MQKLLKASIFLLFTNLIFNSHILNNIDQLKLTFISVQNKFLIISLIHSFYTVITFKNNPFTFKIKIKFPYNRYTTKDWLVLKINQSLLINMT